MKKLILALVLVFMGFCAEAFACAVFYYDENGQVYGMMCIDAAKLPYTKCGTEFGTYWDGNECRKVEVIKKCEEQGGSWKQVSLRPTYNKNIFKNTCICKKGFWNGEKCVSNLTPEIKRNLYRVWCDSLRKEMDVYIPPEIMKR